MFRFASQKPEKDEKLMAQVGTLQNGGESEAKNRRVGRKKLPPGSHFARLNNCLSQTPEKTGSLCSRKGKWRVSRLGDSTQWKT